MYYYTSFKNDFIKDYKDYMLMRLHALQVMCCGQNKILYCNDNLNSVINDAIVSYLSFNWEEIRIYNPSVSYFNYLRYNLLVDSCPELIYEGEKYEKKIIK